jgi:hypothetical protein
MAPACVPRSVRPGAWRSTNTPADPRPRGGRCRRTGSPSGSRRLLPRPWFSSPRALPRRTNGRLRPGAHRRFEGERVCCRPAGWRGTASCIAEAAITALRSEGCNPREAVIALGPAIGRCCYEVGPDVVDAFRGACPDTSWLVDAPGGKTHVDLHAALRSQLTRAGVPQAAIHAAPWCTRCRNDLFFSVRAEGQATGRLMAIIGPAAAP